MFDCREIESGFGEDLAAREKCDLGSAARISIRLVGRADYGDAEAFAGASWASDVGDALTALPDDALPVLIAGSLYLAGKVLAQNGEIPD